MRLLRRRLLLMVLVAKTSRRWKGGRRRWKVVRPVRHPLLLLRIPFRWGMRFFPASTPFFLSSVPSSFFLYLFPSSFSSLLYPPHSQRRRIHDSCALPWCSKHTHTSFTVPFHPSFRPPAPFLFLSVARGMCG